MIFNEVYSLWILTTGLFPSALANTENKIGSYKKEERRTPWPVVLRSRNELGLGANQDTGPTSRVGAQTVSPTGQREGTGLATLLPLQGGTERYLKTRKAQMNRPL